MKLLSILIPLLALLGCNSRCPEFSTYSTESKDLQLVLQSDNFLFGGISKRIAHAGGGIDGNSYTNSHQALDYNYSVGFRNFELDFIFTTDNILVCGHDWGETSRKYLGSSGSVSYSKFLELRSLAAYTPCSMDSLNTWLLDHPDATIITDIKYRNIDGLSQLHLNIENANERVIPQIYFPDEHRSTKSFGFEKIIWTLYRYCGDADTVVAEVNNFEQDSRLFAITLESSKVNIPLSLELEELGVLTFAHTINDIVLYNELKKLGVSEVYTDTLFYTPES